MTVPLRKICATLPSGEQGVELDDGELGVYLAAQLDTDVESARCRRHDLRDRLYRDGGEEAMREVVRKAFTHRSVIELREKMVPFARFNNVLKRIVRELSTVYAEPARRKVDGDENDARYQALIGPDGIRLDEQMIGVNRMANLHRALLVGFRVRLEPDGTRTPVLDVAVPSIVRALLHPNDPTSVVAWAIRTSFRSKRTAWTRPPQWVVWSDHEYFYTDEKFRPLSETYVEHGLGVNRWVPLAHSLGVPGFWPGEEGEDLVSAQLAIWLVNLLLVKETNSATNQTVFTGDTSSMPRRQPIDSSLPIEAPEGVGVHTVDMSMDPDTFMGPSDHILERVANNYGMSAALIKHQGVQSADARELMRMPLRELRREQQPMYRAFERRLAQVMAAVLRKDDPDRAFDPVGWKIDFGEAQTPLSESEEVDLFLKKRGALLDNSVKFVRRRNPDHTDESARLEILENLEVETWRVGELRALQSISGGASDDLPETTAPAPAPPAAPTSSPEGQAA